MSGFYNMYKKENEKFSKLRWGDVIKNEDLDDWSRIHNEFMINRKQLVMNRVGLIYFLFM